MFLGEYRHSLDAKGRLAIPARFRQQLPRGSVMTMGMDHNLALAPPDQYELLVKQIREKEMDRAEQRRLQVLLFSQAVEVEFDSQGRVLVPQKMREYAEITDRAVITGAGNQLHIWAPENWDVTYTEARTSAAEGKESLPIIG